MSQKLIFLSLIAAGALFEVLGDAVLKYWSLSNKATLAIAGLIVYFIGSVFWAYSLWYDSLSKAAVIFTLSNLVLVVVIGLVFFRETLSPRQIIGIGLAIAAILLIEF